MTRNLGEPQPGDEDLQVIIVRRTTLDWVLRTAALAQPHVQILTDQTVTGLVAGPPARGRHPDRRRRAPRPTAARSRPTS